MPHLEDRLRQYAVNLSPAERLASEQLLLNYDDLPFLTSEVVARKAKISASTVVRLVSKLGYGTYMELQAEAQSQLKQRLSSMERMRRIGQEMPSGDGDLELASPSLAQDLRLLLEFAENMSLEDIRRAASLVLEAQTVLIAGFRASAPLAYYLHLGLSGLLGPKIRLASDVTLLPENIAILTEADLFLAISFPRYTSFTIKAAEVARSNQGAQVVAITNSVLSPLAAHASIVLTCPFIGRAFQNSPIASYALAHVLIEQLVTMLDPQVKENVESYLTDSERLVLNWELWHEQ